MDHHSLLLSSAKNVPSGYPHFSTPEASIRGYDLLSVYRPAWRHFFPCPPGQVRSECRYHAPPDPSLHVCEPPADYRPREPEASVLYGVVSEQLETFLARQRRRERSVPRFVEGELRSFLGAGSWRTASYAYTAMPVARTGWSHFPAKAEQSAHPAAAAGWPTPLPTSSIACFRKSPSANGCCRFPSPCAIAWRMTPVLECDRCGGHMRIVTHSPQMASFNSRRLCRVPRPTRPDSLYLTRMISSRLFGIGANDPPTFAAIAVILASVAMLASYLPARRATKVDPMVALR